MKRIFLLINTVLLAIGGSGGPLITRLYFIHGGKSIWLSSCLLTVAFPIALIPIATSYHRSRRRSFSDMGSPKPKMFSMTPLLFSAFTIIGVVTGLSNYLYAYGVARLPVSTATLIMSTQLAFTAIFAFLLVKQKFTFNSVNAIILLIFGAGILAEHAGSDRPSVHVVMALAATLFSIVGMIIEKDFKVISREAQEFGLGETKYYVILVGSAILWQFYMIGAIGIVFCASSLFSGVMVSVMLPITEVLAVIFYKESFQAEKGISLVLSLWGFVSYFYGEFIQAKEMRKNHITETELPLDSIVPV
ncbi:putative purine permease, plant [Lupinus albus]|uniref:Probable purine permease n=1 Tax=Lupinus albus TaxID=3870 RepID=A0A6A4QQC9_LUPAL|nr:putative purine permease, plant [Lupinus albus]